MYCTFVLFVNQHFPGLPTSGTHCITQAFEVDTDEVLNSVCADEVFVLGVVVSALVFQSRDTTHAFRHLHAL
jgi:hypothetical protein